MNPWILVAATLSAGALALPELVTAQTINIPVPEDPTQTGLDDVVSILTAIVHIALLFAASIAAIFIVVSGYQYVLAAGNPEKLEKAKMGLTWSIVGFILAISAYAIVLLTQQIFSAKTDIRVDKRFDGPGSASSVLEGILNLLWTFGGVAAVLFLILGGYRYLTSQGDRDLAEKAKKTILYSVIGIVLIFLSWLITDLVTDQLDVKNFNLV